jgi:hypothetical protein
MLAQLDLDRLDDQRGRRDPMTADLKRLMVSCAGTWTVLGLALLDGTDLPDELHTALHHARVTLDMAGEQLHAHIVSSGGTES